MVSKQQKYLRQQAISRAEKYKEEQAMKLAESNAAKATSSMSKAVTRISLSTDNPQIATSSLLFLIRFSIPLPLQATGASMVQ
jgi:hypothetical protein